MKSGRMAILHCAVAAVLVGVGAWLLLLSARSAWLKLEFV